MNRIALIAVLGGTCLATAAPAETLAVCSSPTGDAACRFHGAGAIQAAVDAAADGDVIRLGAGSYSPAAFRDVPFQDVRIRGFVVIDNKRLTIEAADGAVIDGAKGIPSSAFVLRGSDVIFRNLRLQNFRYAVQEDKIYDGHGIFAINSRVSLIGVTMTHMVKMSLTGRGDSLIEASDLKLLNPHVGIWLEESAHADIRNSIISGGDSAAVAAYMNASANIYNSVINSNRDDGLYAKGSASIFVTNSVITGNKPYAINAEEKGRIIVAHSVVHGNMRELNPKVAKGQLQFGEGIIRADPLLDQNWHPRPGSPVLGKRDPDIGKPIGLVIP